MQDTYLVGAFSDPRARSSVLSVRSSASIGFRVPGGRYPIPGTRYRIRSDSEGRIPSAEDRGRGPGTGKRAHGVCIPFLAEL